MNSRLRLILLAVSLTALGPTSAIASAQEPYAKGEVVVQYRDGTDSSATGNLHARPQSGAGRIETIRLGGESVSSALKRLRRDPQVAKVVPNYIASAADYDPNDPGEGAPGDWVQLQWNFLASAGVNAPAAWDNLIAVGKPGGSGVKVAVLDTGLAYKNSSRFRRAPDLQPRRILSGYDFVDHDNRPLDENGHGTHVTSIMAARVNNGMALTGLAYGVKIIPIRVLDASGQGSASDIAQAIRYAARRGAKVINMSLQFDPEITTAKIPQVTSAVRFADRKGALVVAAAGNFGASPVALPGRVGQVMAVGATTLHRCLAEYSNTGDGLDIVAPGGGDDSEVAGVAGCNPSERGPGIFAQTYQGPFDFKQFRLVSEEGTSEAAPHVSAVAALVIASGKLGKSPSAAAVQQRLESTATDLGAPGYDGLYGNGLLNAAAATNPTV